MTVASGQWTNPCGGTRWRELPSGQIEVENAGIVELPPAFEKHLLACWKNFSPEILAASKKRGVPARYLLAIMNIETGLWAPRGREYQASMDSGCCVGPMAIMVRGPYGNVAAQYGFTVDQIVHDPSANIDAGAAIVRTKLNSGLSMPHVAAAYNSGTSKCCTNSPATPSKPGGRVQNALNLCSASVSGMSYPELAIRGNNTALRLGLVPKSGSSLPPWVFAAGAALLVGGVAVFLVRRS